MCWGFYDLAKGKAAPIATEALTRLAALYRIAASIGGKEAGASLPVGQTESRKLVADLRAWLARGAVGPASCPRPKAEAINGRSLQAQRRHPVDRLAALLRAIRRQICKLSDDLAP